jgi:hypothetical protein
MPPGLVHPCLRRLWMCLVQRRCFLSNAALARFVATTVITAPTAAGTAALKISLMFVAFGLSLLQRHLSLYEFRRDSQRVVEIHTSTDCLEKPHPSTGRVFTFTIAPPWTGAPLDPSGVTTEASYSRANILVGDL